jgi:hypothetical protein
VQYLENCETYEGRAQNARRVHRFSAQLPSETLVERSGLPARGSYGCPSTPPIRALLNTFCSIPYSQELEVVSSLVLFEIPRHVGPSFAQVIQMAPFLCLFPSELCVHVRVPSVNRNQNLKRQMSIKHASIKSVVIEFVYAERQAGRGQLMPVSQIPLQRTYKNRNRSPGFTAGVRRCNCLVTGLK